MKIGFVVNQVRYGGGEKMLAFLMNELKNRGFQIIIYTWDKGWLNDEYQNKYQIHVLHTEEAGVINKIRNILLLKKMLQKTKPDCLIVFSLHLAEVCVFSAKLTKIPVFLSERIDPRNHPIPKKHKIMKKILYYLCDGLVFQTNLVKEFYPNLIQKKSIVIPNPLMLDNFPESHIGTVKQEIIAVGRLSKEKNFEMLIRAFAKIEDREYILRIYGEGELENNLKMLIETLNLKNKVFLMGRSDDIIYALQQSDIFVMPSHYEGMPNALIEAMAVGLACISTDFSSGGARSLIKHNHNGILIPVNDEDALVKALLSLIQNKKFKDQIKQNAVLIRSLNNKTAIIDTWVEYILSK